MVKTLGNSVFKTLSAIDVNEHVKQKGKFSYLSWTWAWATICKHYPTATYKVHKDTAHLDGTYEVNVSITIEGIRHKMWLAVMDNRNGAIANPSARDFGDSRMRCLVKAAAMHGLGHYIYAGESLPEGKDVSEWAEELRGSIDVIKESIASGDYSSGSEAWKELSEEEMRGLWVAPTKGGPFTTHERAVMKSTEFKNGENVNA